MQNIPFMQRFGVVCLKCGSTDISLGVSVDEDILDEFVESLLTVQKYSSVAIICNKCNNEWTEWAGTEE